MTVSSTRRARRSILRPPSKLKKKSAFEREEICDIVTPVTRCRSRARRTRREGPEGSFANPRCPSAGMVIRVSNDVLVVPPFDCAWLSSPDADSLTTASSEGGEGIVVSFDAKADSDVTVILKGRRTSKSELDSRPARRLDHWSGRQDDPAKVDASTYLVIIGSHRNSACVIEKNGRVVELAKGSDVPLLPVRVRDAFTRCFVSWYPKRGALVVVVGDGLVGGKLVDALFPTVEAMKKAGLEIAARASADRPDHARSAIRIEHLVMGVRAR